jgi:sugar O-acyltransferase (sialic acid O-acetyltransferase NeuD family)
MRAILVVGAGGHGKVVADILVRQGKTVAGFVDDDGNIRGQTRLDLPILGIISDHGHDDRYLLAPAIGANAARKTVAERIGSAADRWVSAIHPSATISGSVSLGRGVVIAAGAVINPDAVIGDFTIINTGATVDHDCEIGPFCHIAPGVNLAGGVCVGEGTLIGVGANVIPYRSIGKWVVIGAGAAVTMDVPDYVAAVGVPASWKSNE